MMPMLMPRISHLRRYPARLIDAAAHCLVRLADEFSEAGMQRMLSGAASIPGNCGENRHHKSVTEPLWLLPDDRARRRDCDPRGKVRVNPSRNAVSAGENRPPGP